MIFILDTHVFLWALSAPSQLSPDRRAAIESRVNTVHVSSVSIAELMIKASIGKLTLDFNPVDQAESAGFELLEFGARDALGLKSLPFHHKDPFDRMLIAQSQARGFPIMTDDPKFPPYGCALI